MSAIFILDSDHQECLHRVVGEVGSPEVTYRIDRALSRLEEGELDRPLILHRRLTLSAASDLVQRIRWVDPEIIICMVTENPFMESHLMTPELMVLTEPLRDESSARLRDLLESLKSPEVSKGKSSRRGQRFGRYQALAEIGRGGEGTVYRGWDPVLRRQVAIKRSSKTCMSSLRRTVWEGRNASSIDHPNVVRILDCVQTLDCQALIMELAVGGDLGAKLERERRIPRRNVYALGTDIAKALRAAHRSGIVHGDIKPTNILISGDGVFKLSDFGASGSGCRDLHGYILGTPGYLPPETCFERDFTEAGDTYGLGVLLYRALTGELPFKGSSLVELMEASLGQIVPSCRWADPNPKMSRLIEAMLAKTPEQRPSLDAVIGILESCRHKRIEERGSEINRSSVHSSILSARPTRSLVTIGHASSIPAAS